MSNCQANVLSFILNILRFTTVSKVQFEIYRNDTDVFLTDCSSNGNSDPNRKPPW